MTTGDKIARALAERLRESAGEGWSTTTLQLQVAGGAISLNSWTDVEPYTRVDLGSLNETLLALPHGTVEISLQSTGEYTYTSCPGHEVSNGWVILDPDYRYPGHPLPDATSPDY
ncbi:hypothetical protein ACFQ1S_33885, partial [Kibdelosporangium lantanae]